MTSKVWLLLKVQLLGLFGFNRLRHTSDSKERSRRVWFLVGMAFVVLLMLFYSFMVSFGLGIMGFADALPPLFLAICAVITLVTTVLKTGGVLFGFADYDMVMSLPVTPGQVIVSRLVAVYFMDFLFSAIALVPAGLVYGALTGAGFGVWVMLFLSLFLAPLIPMALGLLLGALVTAVSARFRHKNLVAILASLLLFAGVLAACFGLQNIQVEQISALGSAAAGMAKAIYPPAALFQSAVCTPSVWHFVLFAAISCGAAALFVWVLSKFYAKINSALAARTAKRPADGNFRMGKLSAKSPRKALFIREIRHYVSVPSYVLNTACGGVMLVLFAVVFCFVGPEKLAQTPNLPAGLSAWIGGFAPLIGAFCASISPSTASAVSLEGKSRWIVFSAPVTEMDLFRAKIGVNLTIMLPCVALSGVLFALGLRTTPWQTVLLFALPAAYTFLFSVLGLLVNLRYPQFDWANEYEVVKRGMSVMVTMLFGFVSVLVPLFLAFAIGPELGLSVATVLAAALTVLLYRKLSRVKLFI